MTEQTKNWSSWLSFVIVSVGAAIGLGNLWKFPYIVWKYGGGAFVGVYLVAVCLVALPVLAAELCLGKATRLDVLAAFTTLSQRHWLWKSLGVMVASTPLLILSYYGVVTGWTLYYSGMSAVGSLDASNIEVAQLFFQQLTSDSYLQWGLLCLVMALSCGILCFGLKGLESCGQILLPLLFIMMMITAFCVCYRYGVDETLSFLMAWDFQELTSIAILEAFGHAFLTLSLGMGITVAYGSYLDQEVSVFKAAMTIALFDTASALLSCFMIFPILFGTDIEVSESTAVLFTSLAVEYAKLPMGHYLTTVFFALTFVAALTSCVALLEACLATFEIGLHWTRRHSMYAAVAFILFFGALCVGGDAGLSEWLFGTSFMDVLDFWCSTIATPLGGIAVAWCCTSYLGAAERREALAAESVFGHRLAVVWEQYLKYVSPVLICVILVMQLLKVF